MSRLPCCRPKASSRLFFIGALGISTALAVPARGAGRLELQPSVDLIVTYDDNVFFTSGGGEEDVFTQVSPKIEFKLPFNNALISSGYTGKYLFYSDHSDLNEMLHQAHAAASLFVTRNLTLGVRDEFRIVPLLFGGPEDGVVNLGQANQAAAVLNYNRSFFPTNRTEIEGQVLRSDFLEKNGVEVGESYTQYQGSMRLTEEVYGAENALYAEGRYRIRDFDDAADINGNPLGDFAGVQAIGGAVFQMRALLLEGFGGVEFVNFDGLPDDTAKVVGGRAAVGSRRSRAEVTYHQFLGEDTRGLPFKTRRMDGLIRHELSRRISLEIAAALARFEPDGGGAVDQVMKLGGGLAYLLSPKLDLHVNYRYSRNGGDDFPATDFKNNRVFAQISYRY